MIVELVDPFEHALEIVDAVQDFVSRMDFKECFPKDTKKFMEALSGVLLLEQVDIIAAKEDGAIVGLLVMAFLPHTWNPDMLHGEELIWWTDKDAPKTTGLRLLRFAKIHAKDRGAKVLTFRALTSSPDKTGRVYERMGLREIETVYSGLI
jgi:hypothetical protein